MWLPSRGEFVLFYISSRVLLSANGPAGWRDGLETTPPSGLHSEAANRCCESETLWAGRTMEKKSMIMLLFNIIFFQLMNTEVIVHRDCFLRVTAGLSLRQSGHLSQE